MERKEDNKLIYQRPMLYIDEIELEQVIAESDTIGISSDESVLGPARENGYRTSFGSGYDEE